MVSKAGNHGVWRNPNFIRLWAGTVLSAFGDSAMFVLLSWFVIDVTDSEAVLGTTLLCVSIPRLLFMVIGGVVSDRINRKLVLSFSVFARAIVVSLFSLLLLEGTDSFQPFWVYGMATVFGVVDAFFWPARGSIMPMVVSKEQLPSANSIMETSQQLSMVGGPLIASLLLHTASYPAMFFVVAVAFLGSGLFIITLRLLSRPNEAEPSSIHDQEASVLTDIREGIRYVSKVRILLIFMFTSMFINLFLSGPLSVGLPVMVKSLGWDGSAYSYLQGTISVGAIVGGIACGMANGFRGRMTWVSVFLVIMGAGVAGLSYMSNLWYGLSLMLIIGAMLSITNIPLSTYAQTIVAPHMLGRVTSLSTLMSLGLTPVGYAFCSFFLDKRIAAPSTLLFAGGICLAIASASLLLQRDFRRMEEHPEWQKLGIETKNSNADTSVAL